MVIELEEGGGKGEGGDWECSNKFVKLKSGCLLKKWTEGWNAIKWNICFRHRVRKHWGRGGDAAGAAALLQPACVGQRAHPHSHDIHCWAAEIISTV